MSKQNEETEIKVTINFDDGIEKWNNKNPKLRKLTRKDVIEKDGITKTTIQNWKKGKVPSGLIAVFSFLDRNSLDLKDILKVEKDGKRIL